MNPFERFFIKLAEVSCVPLEEAAESEAQLQKKTAAAKRDEEHQLWQQWKQQPTKQNMHLLLQKFEPDINRRLPFMRAPGVPEPAMKTDMTLNAVKAIQGWDPNHPSGAALRTHVIGTIKQKGYRFNQRHANAAKMPEDVARRIGPVQALEEDLQEEYGRPPTPAEIARAYNAPGMNKRQRLTAAQVQRIQQSQIGDIPASTFESDPTTFAVDRGRQVLKDLRPTLTMQAQGAFDHIFGENGQKPIKSNRELAKRLGISEPQASKLRTEILAKYNYYR